MQVRSQSSSRGKQQSVADRWICGANEIMSSVDVRTI